MSRPWATRIVSGIAGLGLLFGALVMQNAANALVPQRSLAEQVELIAPGTSLYLPENRSGPVPTIILFHGCGGLRPMHHDHAEAIVEAGYGVLVVDSFAPRGIGRISAMIQVCSAMRLWGQERAADVFAAIEIARQSPEIDHNRLVLAGWSHGGWTLLDAISYASENVRLPALTDGDLSLEGVSRIVPIYPYCSFPARARGRLAAGLPPIDLVLAGRDMVAPVGDCKELAFSAVSAGANVEFEVWENVTHAFDDTDAPALDFRMQYDAEAALRLRARLIAALRETQD